MKTINIKRYFITLFFLLLVVSLTPGTLAASTPFTSSFVTMSNSRFSFKGQIAANVGVNTSTVTINSTGPDVDVNNLFPSDTICFNGLAGSGCTDVTTTYKVTNNVSNTIVGFSPLKVSVNALGDNLVSSQTGTFTITFKPTTAVPSGGKIVVTIPAAGSSYNDGIPDSTGFDSNLLTANLIGGSAPAPLSDACPCFTTTGFTVNAVTLSSAATLHTITATLGVTLVQNTQYSLTVGKSGSSKMVFINPTPTSVTHVRGVADTYTVALSTQDGSGNTLDSTNMKVAPQDGVFVSVTVEETISYTIAAVTTGAANPCGNQGGGSTPTANSTGSTVPFGSYVLGNTFANMAQTHTVITNATSGYTLTVFENNVLSKDGLPATNITIPDTRCDSGPCTTATPQTWATGSNNGFGYTLANITGTDAIFTWSQGYKPFSTSATNIMTKSSPTSTSSIYTCYRLSASPTQQTGYYYNILTYTATPMF